MAAIALAGGTQKASQQSTTLNTLGNLAFPGNVTSGNTIIVAVAAFDNGVVPTINTPTKAAGTSTIGAFTLDKNATGTSGASNIVTSIYRASVTGTGSLTIGFTLSNASASGSAISEYTNFNATPVDGTPVANTGTSVTESTGNITTTGSGMIYMISSELSTGNFTYTFSDVSIANFSTGASQFTYESQHKITASSGTYALTAATANSWFWSAIGVAYRDTTVTGGAVSHLMGMMGVGA